MNIYVIGDTQVRKGVKNPLVPVAWDIIHTLPDKVVHLGDHFDFPSLSNYDKGKISFQSKRYIDDVDAGNLSFEEFWSIIEIGKLENPDWECEFIYLNGNHCYRRDKALDEGPAQMSGLLDLYKPDFTHWHKVMPFLKPYVCNGIVFVHFLANEFSGRAISTASAGIKSRGSSFVAGHKQCLDTAEFCSVDGRRVMGLIMGACYFHEESYKGPQSNHHFRGTAYLRNCRNGEWEAEMRNLKTLDKKYR
jgi:hypothetical protein